MNKLRARKIEARANRQEALHSRGMPTVEKTIIQVPQPKALVKKEVMKVIEKSNKSPKTTVEVKRGRGRPRKETTENINKSTKHLQVNKKVTATGKGKK